MRRFMTFSSSAAVFRSSWPVGECCSRLRNRLVSTFKLLSKRPPVVAGLLFLPLPRGVLSGAPFMVLCSSCVQILSLAQ
eukprot:1736-Heterococcus_DN1.PRE.1